MKPTFAPFAAPILCLLGQPVFADTAPAFSFPVLCELQESCFLQQFVDHDPGPGWRDYACGTASYDGHTGTDIRVADFEAMAEGWTVVAAAAGEVVAIRDAVPDAGTDAAPEGQGCGNGVVLTHGDGWETQYCHLALGSVAVAVGDRVEAGTPLGQIGYSGNTEFPHLEFIVRDPDGVVRDPFHPADIDGCEDNTPGAFPPLWASPIFYQGGGLLSAGFSAALPEFEAIQAGTADAATLPGDSPALVLWGYIYNGRTGDRVELIITAPDGTRFHYEDNRLEANQAHLFRASGRRLSEPLAPGTYRGTVLISRDEALLDHTVVSVDVP